MASLKNVTTDHMENVMRSFVERIKTQTALGVDSDNYIRKVLTYYKRYRKSS